MSEPLFALEGVSIETPVGPLLTGLDWRVSRGRVTALLGPAGTGKSALLRGLAGEPAPPGWRLRGSWRHLGCELSRDGTPLADLAWVRQPTRSGRPAESGALTWREALSAPASTLLLDEPTRGLPDEQRNELADRLRARAPTGGVVLVTHDVSFARSVADEVALLCAGRLVATGDAASFFETPPNELAATFVRQGNCWPGGPWPPALPAHFRWLLPGRLAGMGRPGLLGELEADLEALAASGVKLLVTLTEDPPPIEALRALGLQGRHFPVTDMGVPAISPTASLCREIERAMSDGAVALHCHAGMGRTGTLLAAMLVWLGDDAEAAVRRVRNVARGYIQNSAQLDFVRRFAAAVGPLQG